MTETISDPIRAFHAALTPHAARLCPRGQDIDRLVYAALTTGGHTPQTLAKHVGGTDHGLTLTAGRMRWRLHRAAGLDDDQEGTD